MQPIKKWLTGKKEDSEAKPEEKPTAEADSTMHNAPQQAVVKPQ